MTGGRRRKRKGERLNGRERGNGESIAIRASFKNPERDTGAPQKL